MISYTSTKARLLGRYTLTWNDVTDWYKTNVRRRKSGQQIIPPTPIVQPDSQKINALPQQPAITFTAPGLADKLEPKPSKGNKAVSSHQFPQKLIELEKQSHEVLFKGKTVFPFILVPDTIILDRAHLTIIHRTFFRVAKITSVRIEDILTADLNVGPFFGSLKVATRYFINQDTGQGQGNVSEIKSPSITYLWKHDAMEVHKLLQGFIAATQRKIDTSQIETSELVRLLRGLGDNDDTRYEG